MCAIPAHTQLLTRRYTESAKITTLRFRSRRLYFTVVKLVRSVFYVTSYRNRNSVIRTPWLHRPTLLRRPLRALKCANLTRSRVTPQKSSRLIHSRSSSRKQTGPVRYVIGSIRRDDTNQSSDCRPPIAFHHRPTEREYSDESYFLIIKFKFYNLKTVFINLTHRILNEKKTKKCTTVFLADSS